MEKISKAKFVICIFLCIFIALSIVGAFIYQNNKDIICGTFFRKMYGSIGVVGENKYYVKFSLFCFQTDATFLNSVEKCSINGGANLFSVYVEEEAKESDLIVYNIILGISFPSKGQYDITEFYYDDETGIRTFQLGKLSFLYYNEDPIFMNFGMDSQIVNGNISYSFGENLESIFTIKDVLLAKDDNVRYQYEPNCTYSPGAELRYNINIDYSVSEGDLFVIQPIFQIESESAEYNGMVVPIMLAYFGEDMTYIEIKEYVQ